jgi:hypothetical protein
MRNSTLLGDFLIRGICAICDGCYIIRRRLIRGLVDDINGWRGVSLRLVFSHGPNGQDAGTSEAY